MLRNDRDLERAIREGELELRSECSCSSDDDYNAVDDPLETLLATGKYFIQSEWRAGDEADNNLAPIEAVGSTVPSQEEK
jgi:hypothetical protein